MSTNSFDSLLDAVALGAFSMTRAEALEKGICIDCKKPPTLHSEAGRKEYPISGLCEPCFDAIAESTDE